MAVRRSVYFDVILGEEVVAREIAKDGAFVFSRGNKPSTVEGRLIKVLAPSSPSGDRIADEAFYH